jgi:ferredoxin
MIDERKPHALNVAGPFYVEDGCCTACGVPEAIAPELFAYDSSTHCYVKRQPESVSELEAALRVVRTQELGCVRFRGNDEVVLRRLAEAGESAACDYPLEGVDPVVRNVVSFVAADGPARPKSYFEDFATYLRVQYPHASFQTRAGWLSRESFELSWFEDQFHQVLIRTGERVVIEHHGLRWRCC